MRPNIFENAKFGTLLQTKDGAQAVYIANLPYEGMHKILVQNFEYPFKYFPDGQRRGGGRYAQKYGDGLDIIKILN